MTTTMFANIITEWNEGEDQIEEAGLLFADAEHNLTRYCNDWDDDLGEGPFIQEIFEPAEHKKFWLEHASSHFGIKYGVTLLDLMVDTEDFYQRLGENGTILPVEACEAYAEQYRLKKID